MTAQAPMPGQAQAAPGPAQPATASPAAATSPATTTTTTGARAPAAPATPATPGKPTASGRRRDAASTPRAMRVARGLAAAACLVPGTAAFVTLSSAAAPTQQASPALIRAELGRDTAATRTSAALAWATGKAEDRQATSAALAGMSHDLGSAAVVRPDWNRQIDAAQAKIAAQTAPVIGALSTKPADPTTSAGLLAALDVLEEVPATLPALTDATGNDTRRTAVWALGALSVLTLLGASGWLARKTHRVINPGLAVAIVGTAAVAVLAGQTLSGMVTSSQAEAIAGARVDAANALAAEAQPLLSTSTVGAATKDRDTALSTGLAKLRSADAPGSAMQAWTDFQGGKLTLSATAAPKADQVAQRVSQLRTLDAALASAQSSAEGGLRGSATPIGYGLLALSILSAGAAWTGVGRRVAEYR